MLTKATLWQKRCVQNAARLLFCYVIAWALNFYTTPWPPKPSHYIPDATLAYDKWWLDHVDPTSHWVVIYMIVVSGSAFVPPHWKRKQSEGLHHRPLGETLWLVHGGAMVAACLTLAAERLLRGWSTPRPAWQYNWMVYLVASAGGIVWYFINRRTTRNARKNRCGVNKLAWAVALCVFLYTWLGVSAFFGL